MDRQDIYVLIDDERQYQDNVRPQIQGDAIPDSEKSVADFILYIEKHLNDAKLKVYQLNEYGAMGELRKVAALCVAAMENNDTPPRIN